MTYTLSNMCAKNLCKRTLLVQLIIKNVVTCFFGTQCRMVEFGTEVQVTWMVVMCLLGLD